VLSHHAQRVVVAAVVRLVELRFVVDGLAAVEIMISSTSDFVNIELPPFF
jgi:hypothetical protein